jgi:DNA invertase Pin-like site-specific DNA recombinase
MTMKTLIAAALAATVLAAPALSFAQESQPLTRAQVRAELVQLEQAGYRPGVSSPYYPADLQAAQAKVAQQNATAETTAYGASTNGSTQAGARVTPNAKSVYFGQ